MGIRIIRTGSTEFQGKFAELKEQQLLIETQIWQRLTAHETHDLEDLLARFHVVKSKDKQLKIEESTAEVTAGIKTQKNSLSNIQGNMEIQRLGELLK